jgi:hypothetical protein
MLNHWIFMAAISGICVYGLFYSLMLLIAPNRCPAHYKSGQPSLQLVRKPPLQLGKRFLGLCMSAGIVIIFVRPIVAGILHPASGTMSGGESQFSRGVARWDILAVGLLGAVAGYYLLTHPENSVELMFYSDTDKLKDKITLRIWTLAEQAAAVSIMLLSLVSVVSFVGSLRSWGNQIHR